MNHVNVSPSRLFFAAMLSFALFATLPGAVLAQGVKAKATAAVPANPEIAKLRRQLSALEERIAELEKDEVEAPDDPDEAAREEAHDKALERRLAALEKSASEAGQQSAAPGSDKNDDAGSTQNGARFAKLEARITHMEQARTITAPFTVVDARDRVLMRVDAGAGTGATLSVGGGDGGLIALDTSNAVASVRVSAGSSAQATLLSSNGQAGVLVGSTKPMAFIGVDGNDPTVTVNNINGDAVVGMTADKDGGRIDVLDPAGTHTAARMSSSASGGSLRAFDSEGNAVAGMLGGKDGGRLALTGTGGGKTAVSLSVAEEGGVVRVFPSEGGKTRAELAATSSGGALNLFDTAGANAASIDVDEGKAGHLEFANGSGSIVVQAGTTQTNRLGFVSTGPFDGGIAGRQGNTAMPASSLVGRKGGK
ncbi:MAG: hypothetical protein H7Y19_15755 [Luteimonas sp.]|nr:hypothetical protein [Luteimonas sp.]